MFKRVGGWRKGRYSPRGTLEVVMFGRCLRWIAVSCALGAGTASLRAETITIGAENDWPPYSYRVPGQDEPQGLTPRLVRQAFASQGVSVRYRMLPFARCMLEAERGAVAGCFNASRTAANEALYHWHPTPMLEEELAIFARRRAVEAASSALPTRQLTQADLRGKSVGITVGYTYATSFMTDPQIQRKPATSDGNLLHMLAAGRVDYIVVNTLPAWYRLRGDPALQGQVQRVGRISIDGFWLAFTRAKPEGERLAQVFERGLQAMRLSGEQQRMLAELRQQWEPAAAAKGRP